jgi:hypothetical protein
MLLLSFKATSCINAYIHDYGTTFHVFYHSFSNDYWTAFYAGAQWQRRNVLVLSGNLDYGGSENPLVQVVL